MEPELPTHEIREGLLTREISSDPQHDGASVISGAATITASAGRRSWLKRFLDDVWYRWTVPVGRSTGDTFARQDLLRRARLTSTLLLLATCIWLGNSPAEILIAGVATGILVILIGCLLIGALLYLNRHGWVTATALALIMAVDLGFWVAMHSAHGGPSTRAGNFALLIYPELIAAALLIPASVFGVTLTNILFIVLAIASWPSAVRDAGLTSSSIFNVLFSPITTQVVVATISFLWSRNILRALRQSSQAEALAVANAQLQAANLQQEKLAQQATESARLKSEFLANMSHELRTPMNGIIGMTELALQRRLEPDLADYIRTAHDSALALLAVLNDILDFSKVEAGKLELECIDFQPRAVAEDVTELLALHAAEKRLALMVYVAPEVPLWLRGDTARLRQILLNLVSNAIKFTERGHVLLRVVPVEATATEPGGASVDTTLHFEVVDTGIGLAPEAVGRLFQPFVQADGSTTRKYGGTGLGLSISRRLVELMDGEIGVESIPDLGSTFWFTGQFATSGVPATGKASEAARAALRDRRVLVVDDNAAQLATLQQYLTSWGMTVEVASDGRGALARLHRAAEHGMPFDVAILDLALPGVEGFALAQTIQRDLRFAQMRLLLLTAYDEVGLGQQALRAGFSACLTKPLKYESLLGTLWRILLGEADASLDGAAAKRAAQSSAAGARRQFPGQKILLAEDNVINRKLAVLQLERLGCVVDNAADGRVALAKLDAQDYALVLMDCHMPEMDGFEATRVIRAREQSTGEHIPIIAMTADALQGDRERCLAVGMDDYVAKPVTLERLEATLTRWLRPATDHNTPVTTAPEPAASPL